MQTFAQLQNSNGTNDNIAREDPKDIDIGLNIEGFLLYSKLCVKKHNYKSLSSDSIGFIFTLCYFRE